MHTPRDYNRGGEYADYGRGGAFGGQRTSGTAGYGTSGSYGDYRMGGALRGYSGAASGFRGAYDRDLGQFVSNGHPPSEWWGGSGPHAGKGPRDYYPADGRIEDQACDVLTRHGHVDASGICVLVRNGEITLEGTVGSRREKRAAEDAVESTPASGTYTTACGSTTGTGPDTAPGLRPTAPGQHGPSGACPDFSSLVRKSHLSPSSPRIERELSQGGSHGIQRISAAC